MIDFNLYNEQDVPFLDKDKKENEIILDNIIDGDIDDDCQTDAEQHRDAGNMLLKDLQKSISLYID